jgi:hypothetical protein
VQGVAGNRPATNRRDVGSIGQSTPRAPASCRHHRQDGISKIVVRKDRGVASHKGREGDHFFFPSMCGQKQSNKPEAMTAAVAPEVAYGAFLTSTTMQWRVSKRKGPGIGQTHKASRVLGADGGSLP